MAGIYIHIPFCRSKCIYCNFYSVVSLKDQKKVLEVMLSEVIQKKAFLGAEPIETIYFGGGTPSLIEPAWIARFLDTVYKNYRVVADPEITIEANPDDLTVSYLNDIIRLANRISIGIQSFAEEELIILGRKHNAQQASEAVSESRKAGFENISIDLIYGISEEYIYWKKSLFEALQLDPEHISAYALTVEERSVLQRNIRKKEMRIASDESVEEQYNLLTYELGKAGYEHYEISNFSKPGYASKHNGNYWNGQKYLGIGPAAHSFEGDLRQWNFPNILQYCKAIKEGSNSFEREILSEKDKYNEFIMLHLRQKKGVDTGLLQLKFGKACKEYFIQQAQPYLLSGQILNQNALFHLTENAFLRSDGIIASLFME